MTARRKSIDRRYTADRPDPNAAPSWFALPFGGMTHASHRRSVRLVLMVMAICLFVAGCGSDGDTADTTSPADSAPAVATAETESPAGPTLDASVLSGTATTVDGSAFDLGDLAGTDLVVWFWAPW